MGHRWKSCYRVLVFKKTGKKERLWPLAWKREGLGSWKETASVFFKEGNKRSKELFKAEESNKWWLGSGSSVMRRLVAEEETNTPVLTNKWEYQYFNLCIVTYRCLSWVNQYTVSREADFFFFGTAPWEIRWCAVCGRELESNHRGNAQSTFHLKLKGYIYL